MVEHEEHLKTETSHIIRWSIPARGTFLPIPALGHYMASNNSYSFWLAMGVIKFVQ
jgi:hypothetical protein